MSRPGPAALTSLQTVFETKRGKVLPLPRSRPHVSALFVPMIVALGRPVRVAVDRAGALLVADDVGNVI